VVGVDKSYFPKVVSDIIDTNHKLFELTVGKLIESIFNKVANQRFEKYYEEIQAERAKARLEIENNYTDPDTKTALLNLSGITNKHYKKLGSVRTHVKNIRENTSTNNSVVHNRIREIMGERT
jgi:hypothetical protein